MRHLMLPLALVLAFAAAAPHSAQATCTVPDVYLEALGEHQDTLLGYSIALNTGGGVLANLDTAAVNYQLLIAMRRYHQDARATLPACAQAVNTATLDSIAAAQDAFAMLFLNTAATNNPGYERDLIDAVAGFRAAFGGLTAARNTTPLTPGE